MAALIAPGLSMAMDATGTPAGICTLDSNESMPFKTVVAMGTAITGRIVSAATTPARWAAPPAATIMVLSPRSRAVVAYSCVRAGERCADVTSISYGIPNFSSIFAASDITAKSESEPMMIPTIGFRCVFAFAHVLLFWLIVMCSFATLQSLLAATDNADGQSRTANIASMVLARKGNAADGFVAISCGGIQRLTLRAYAKHAAAGGVIRIVFAARAGVKYHRAAALLHMRQPADLRVFSISSGIPSAAITTHMLAPGLPSQRLWIELSRGTIGKN